MLVTNIQRMCFHDGPGIRTTVFTKGCSLHCPWCSNPENISFIPEEYKENGITKTYGREYSPEELVDILMKDQGFWDGGGGVTFSGGEALMQADALRDVLSRLKENNVHTAAETALFVPEKILEMIMPYIDYFIVDIKILDAVKCRETLGGEISLYLKNVETLYQAHKLCLLRIPCCPEYTFTEENKRKLFEILKKYDSVPVQLFQIHELGEKKYKSLNRMMWRSRGVSDEELADYQAFLRKNGIDAEIIHI